MKRIFKDYFTFSKKERQALVVLVLLMAVFIAIPYFYKPPPTPPVSNPALEEYIARSLRKTDPVGDSFTRLPIPEAITQGENPTPELFPFNPNKATQEEWQRLGLSAKTAQTILRYTSKGGRFRKADDLRKIWGMRKEQADRLVPYVRLEEARPLPPPIPGAKQRADPIIHKPVPLIDVNTANEEEWKALPGIGEVLAQRILRFREVAGGFTGIEEVRKTYGLSDTVFIRIAPFLTTSEATLPKWDLNQLSAWELQRKLKIDASTARSIVGFRKKNGPFQSPTDLLTHGLVSDTQLLRVRPFLKTG